MRWLFGSWFFQDCYIAMLGVCVWMLLKTFLHWPFLDWKGCFRWNPDTLMDKILCPIRCLKHFKKNCDAWNACHMNKWKVNAYTYVFRAPVLLQSHLLRVLPRWAHHETLRNGGHVLRELQGASNASSLQPWNVDQHVQKTFVYISSAIIRPIFWFS